MMFLLALNVSFQTRDMRRAYPKRPVTSLPVTPLQSVLQEAFIP